MKGHVFLPSLFVSDDPYFFKILNGAHFPSEFALISSIRAGESDQRATRNFEILKAAVLPSVGASPNLENHVIDDQDGQE